MKLLLLIVSLFVVCSASAQRIGVDTVTRDTFTWNGEVWQVAEVPDSLGGKIIISLKSPVIADEMRPGITGSAGYAVDAPFITFDTLPSLLIGSGVITTAEPNYMPLPYYFTGEPQNINRGRFEITHPKRTVSGWMQHEQFKIKSYPVTHGKVLGWAICAFAGFTDGVVEGYEFDGRTSFERKYGASPLSFWGSGSWKRAYPDNDPEQRMKPVWRVIGTPDFYHFADDGRKIGYISGAVVIGFSGAQVNKKPWHYFFDFAASLAISGAAKSAGMYWIRH